MKPVKISVQEVDSCEEEEIIIKCHEMNDDIMELVRRLKMEQHRLTAYRDDKVLSAVSPRRLLL